MKYAENYGVNRASRKYSKSRSYIYFWKSQWDGSVGALRIWRNKREEKGRRIRDQRDGRDRLKEAC